MELREKFTHHGGTLGFYTHHAASVQCPMSFSVFTPPGAGPFPALFWLSGLTCTEENFTTKAGAYKHAAALGMMIIAPDTSPRGKNVPDDPDGAYDFGLGAGFYLNATEAPFDQYYQMYRYIAEDLPALIAREFHVDISRAGISGHSMGGHGALTIGLKNRDIFKSISAFAPIVAPARVPWGQKALTGYLGPDKQKWRAYDACALMEDIGGGASGPMILIDQGKADNFLEAQLKPHLFETACQKAGQALNLRLHEGYDHSYYFVASFIDEHLEHHARILEIV